MLTDGIHHVLAGGQPAGDFPQAWPDDSGDLGAVEEERAQEEAEVAEGVENASLGCEGGVWAPETMEGEGLREHRCEGSLARYIGPVSALFQPCVCWPPAPIHGSQPRKRSLEPWAVCCKQ